MVLVVALIVLGPNRLPDAARSVGKAINELRKMTSGLQNEVKDAFAEPAPSYPRPTAPADPPPASPVAALPARPEDAEMVLEPEDDQPPPAGPR